jgi:hypothetical protein
MVQKTQDSLSKEGWVTIVTTKGRQSILLGGYDPAKAKTVSWNVIALEVDVETETEALLAHDAGYYDIFNVVGVDEIPLSVI